MQANVSPGGIVTAVIAPVRDAAPPSATDMVYTYRAYLIGAAHRFALEDEGLNWQVGGRTGFWPYRTIATVRLSYRPVSMQSHRYRADLTNASGERLRILSTSWETAALLSPQDGAYRAFIVALHRHLQQAGGEVRLTSGLRPPVYGLAVAALAMVALAMAALLVRALITRQWPGALFVVGFAALFAWQVGGFVRRNRPRKYMYGQIPDDVLPRG